EAKGLTKRYGSKLAVDDITFEVRPGIVTGFLGPNGAGKSTTMRMIMGLDKPTSGTVTVNGVSYAGHRAPMTEVGALLEARAVHPGRSARKHLQALAATHHIPQRRVDEVIALTGLESVADKRVGSYSLGMGQRLGIASALLGDPKTLILDEPVNGLDPEGVLWVRHLAKYLAGQGRTVFLSSHLMNEMAITADHVIVIGKGKILADVPIRELVEKKAHNRVRVVTPDAELLQEAIKLAGGHIGEGVQIVSGAENVPAVQAATAEAAGVAPGEPVTRMTRRERRTGAIPPVHAGGRPVYSLVIEGLPAPAIGQISMVNGVELHELSPMASTLEDAYMELTQHSVEFQSEQMNALPEENPGKSKRGRK
ncbi:MAG: ATP-binding cassette domain-containing protein, partial [Promicromonosporaceae bacterium]|nr:ATP-binding cassette domain-containing protein [Promicromonosporaceae bacterium]